MTRYQKTHDIKLLRPLILPLTQVSRNVPALLIYSKSVKLSPIPHVPRSPETQVVGKYMALSNRAIKMHLLLGALTVYPVSQAPVFISFFIALREMANLPVPSLQTGGLWWFQDLTVSDPIYVLPLVVTATMWCVLEVSQGWPSARPASKHGVGME